MQRYFFESKGIIGNFVVEAKNESHALARGTAIAEMHKQELLTLNLDLCRTIPLQLAHVSMTVFLMFAIWGDVGLPSKCSLYLRA